MKLNNWLQSRYGNTKHLKWDDFQLGPEHAGQWIAIALCADFSAVNISLL